VIGIIMEEQGIDSKLLKLDQNIGLEFIVRKSLEWVMGSALDLAKISEMSERSYKQFDRTMKDNTNRAIEFTINALKDRGFIK
jgi:hypothetical protein